MDNAVWVTTKLCHSKIWTSLNGHLMSMSCHVFFPSYLNAGQLCWGNGDDLLSIPALHSPIRPLPTNWPCRASMARLLAGYMCQCVESCRIISVGRVRGLCQWAVIVDS